MVQVVSLVLIQNFSHSAGHFYTVSMARSLYKYIRFRGCIFRTRVSYPMTASAAGMSGVLSETHVATAGTSP